MKKHLVVATGNRNKMKEIREILKDLEVEILSMEEAGVCTDIVEDGSTFEENAVIKAKTVALSGGEMAIADDSGLVIDALDGAPGIYSARFMGHDTPYDEKNDELIRRVNAYCAAHEAEDAAGTPEKNEGADAGKESGSPSRPGADEGGNPGPLRSARFVCAVAVAWPDGRIVTATGTMEGRIAWERKGENGFGYDPIFFLPQYGMTSAQITPEEKNRISHRGQAFRRMHALLEEELGKVSDGEDL
jgi:XTP/dITP diphosphohydrolase